VQDQTKLIARLKKLDRLGLPKTPDQINVENQIESLQAAIPTLENFATQYGKIVSVITDDNALLSQGLGKLIGIQASFNVGIMAQVKNLTYLEESNSKLNTSFGLSSKSAQVFATRLRDLSIAGNIGSDKMFAYAESVKDLTSGFIQASNGTDKFQKKLLQGQQYMKNNLKVTDAAAEGYEYYASSLNQTGIETIAIQNEMAASLSKATGIDQLSIQKDLTETIGSLTADLQMQYSRIPGSLELSVLKARALGLSLSNLNATGTSLLNIESSIGTEMEYQLLSGKRLLTADGKSLTNAYRMATIQGDSNKQADLMNQLIKDQGPMLEKNLFARKKAAELLGTDEATLARSIQKQKLITKLGAENLMRLSNGDMTQVAAQLRAKGVNEDDIKKLITASDTRTTAERELDLQQQTYDLTVKMYDEKIDVTEAGLTAQKKAAEYIPLKTSLDDIATGKALGAVTSFGESVTAVNKPIKTLAAQLPLFGTALTAMIDWATTATSINLTTGKLVATENDALVMNDGLIKFNPADKFMQVNDSTMVAGTNVDGNKKLARAISGGGGSIDYNKLASAIASAMQHVTVQATVKPDMLFAASKLNGKRRF
jgi:hypothetical protein